MKERALEIHEFGSKLKIKPADSNDVLIMKSATGREKDNDDIILIEQRSKINWNQITEAAQEQVDLGNELAILSLGNKLEKLTMKRKLPFPNQFLILYGKCSINR